MVHEGLDAVVEGYPHPAEPEVDTRGEQAGALLRDLHESFAPTYLTLISIIEGVLLGFMFELLSEGRPDLHLRDPAALLVLNNVVLIILVWNEYRMGAFMFRWIPSIADAIIPFSLGGMQAGLILTVSRPVTWLAWLGAFYLVAAAAYQNMYLRSAREACNALVLENNRLFRWLNPLGCLVAGSAMSAFAAIATARGLTIGWAHLSLITLVNVVFLARGEVNWRAIVAVAREAHRTSTVTQPLSGYVLPPQRCVDVGELVPASGAPALDSIR